jgi:hypothetical protein
MSKLTEHPFAAWIGGLAAENQVQVDGARNNDIKLRGLAAKRFALGVFNEQPLLAILPEDQAAFQAIRWSSAALLINRDDSDWIALSSKDIRPGTPAGGEPSPMRLFIPVQHHRLLAWKNVDPKQILHIGVMNVDKEKGLPTNDGSPFMNLQAMIFFNPDKPRARPGK